MKILILGTGKKDDIYRSKFHPCLSNKEYLYCVSIAKEEGVLYTLDNNKDLDPDVVANVGTLGWSDLVLKKDKQFDIVIDAIGPNRFTENYHTEVAKLLKSDGMFYGYKNSEKYIWFNTNNKLYVSNF